MKWPGPEAKVDSYEAVVCDSGECCGKSLCSLSMTLDCGGAAALRTCWWTEGVCMRKPRKCKRGLQAPERWCA